MAFFEERFPDDIAQGATGGPRWQTSKARATGGGRSANKDWSDALHYFEVSHAIKTRENFERVRAFFYVVAGSFDPFRFKDFSNYRVKQAVGVLTDVGSNDWQMFKAERYGVREYLRRIQKPVPGSATFWRTRSAVTTIVTPTVDYTTGLVAFVSPQMGDTYAWAGEFDVPCAFADDSMESAQQIGPNSGLYISWPSIPLEEVPLEDEA